MFEINPRRDLCKDYVNMDPSVTVLIITGIFALLGFGVIVAAFLVSENKLKNINSGTGTTDNTGTAGDQGFPCTTHGTRPLAPAPAFTRISNKSAASRPLSTTHPNFDSIDHSVQKLYRTRSLKEIVSPNHWLGNAMYGDDNIFLAYPYLCSIKDEGLVFSWPETGTVEEICGSSGTCGTGNQDLIATASHGTSLEIGSSGSKWLSCDIVDVDALVSTAIWQYQNSNTGRTGSIKIPIAKGSPFITAEINNIETTIECSESFSLESMSGGMIYYIKLADTKKSEGEIPLGGSGYLIFLPTQITLTVQFGIIVIPRMTGVIRLAYFNSTDMFDLLVDYYSIYPIESTISTKVTSTGPDGSVWNVDTSFVWTTKQMAQSSSNNQLLTLALPHHNITNTTFESPSMDHAILGPFRFVTTENPMWNLADAVANYQFEYPGITGTGSDELISVWKSDVLNIKLIKPYNTVDWMKWLGSLAILVLMGEMLKQDTTSERQLLESQLSLIQERRGGVSTSNTLVYDNTWGGIISNLGLTNCMGNSDGGNAFYESHIGQFGYLVFGYAVAGYFNTAFINANRETALFFVRTIANPYEFDTSFPLWRNKDWYFGYSLSSGLSPAQSGGKSTSNVAENILGYYGSFLISKVLTGLDESELLNWSLGMLASEIASAHYYFQFSGNNAITVDPIFVQGTITTRGDTYYSYTVTQGNSYYPERNASMMVPMLKPLTLISFDYINNTWASEAQNWLQDAAASNNIQAESLAYALAVLSVNPDQSTLQSITTKITDNQHLILPYGSTWSSVLYWALSQSNQ